MTAKEQYKAAFKKELDRFAAKLKHYVSTDSGDWTVKGFIDVFKNIYTISADTKIISKIRWSECCTVLLELRESQA